VRVLGFDPSHLDAPPLHEAIRLDPKFGEVISNAQSPDQQNKIACASGLSQADALLPNSPAFGPLGRLGPSLQEGDMDLVSVPRNAPINWM